MKRLLAVAGLAFVVISCLTYLPEAFTAHAPVYQAKTLPDIPDATTIYTADVQVDPQNHRVTGKLHVQFPATLQEKAYFHLYPNAFENEKRLTGAKWDYLLGEDRQPGKMMIGQVLVDGQAVTAARIGEDRTILEVPLGVGRKDHPVRQIDMQFELIVPLNDGRISYNDHAIWLGNWLPILAIKDAAGWHLDPYYPMGDPFYSDIADYHVTVTLPSGYQLASTGLESKAVMTEWRPSGGKRYELDARNVRDFAMVVMDGTYRELSTQAGDTLVRTWWQEGDDLEQVRRMHETAVRSLAYYGEEFAPYPYEEYDVVKTGGFFGGMEYPGIVFIEGGYYEERRDYGTIVVAHETAHQWFYGLVGNDEVREAWVDEGLTDYATMAFIYRDSPDLGAKYVEMRKAQAKAASQYSEQGLSVWQPLPLFPTWQSYSELVYSRAASMLWDLREAWGEDAVHAALCQYVEQHQYGQGRGEDVVQIFSDVSGGDATPYFDYWLHLKQEKLTEAEAWKAKGKDKFSRQ
ncbi:MAG TPA: M1 family metallopeptidase [Candidatus Bathyarchaeia archaeon]|nr:M1 family metallopeptidase [Candidatus Bathyarchaeia archaeon]